MFDAACVRRALVCKSVDLVDTCKLDEHLRDNCLCLPWFEGSTMCQVEQDGGFPSHPTEPSGTSARFQFNLRPLVRRSGIRSHGKSTSE